MMPLLPRRWKALQRFNYGLFGLVILHWVLYQRIEDRFWPFVLAFGLLVAVVVALQVAGIWQHHHRQLSQARPPDSTPNRTRL